MRDNCIGPELAQPVAGNLLCLENVGDEAFSGGGQVVQGKAGKRDHARSCDLPVLNHVDFQIPAAGQRVHQVDIDALDAARRRPARRVVSHDGQTEVLFRHRGASFDKERRGG